MTTHPTDAEGLLPLHPTDFRILMVLREGARHGYQIVKTLQTMDGRNTPLYPGNLYRRLRNLRSRGLLEDAPTPAPAETDPRRRYFRITAFGRAVAEAEARRLRDLADEARDAGLLSES